VCLRVRAHVCMLTCMAVSKILPYLYVTRLHILMKWSYDCRLVHDRELQLHDGHRLVRYDRFDEYKTRHNLSEQQLRDSGLL
jgi:hypothetical protein